MAAAEPIKNKKHLKALTEYYLKKGQLRNYTLIIMGSYTALRISDLLRLKWSDVYDERLEAFRTHITLTEKKTGKPKIIALNRHILGALRQCYTHRDGEFIFTNHRKRMRPSAGYRRGGSSAARLSSSGCPAESPATVCARPGDITPGQAAPYRPLLLWIFIITAAMTSQEDIWALPRMISTKRILV